MRQLAPDIIAMTAFMLGGMHNHFQPTVQQVTRKYKLLLHVDACLGGFVLPFARKLGYPIPPIDFSVKGLTSMSADPHKFDMAHKGTSVVLYQSTAIRSCGSTSPARSLSESEASSRKVYTTCQGEPPSCSLWTIKDGWSMLGGLIATAWSSSVHMGEQGFMHITHQLMQAAQHLAEAVKQIDGLEVVGKPDMCLVAIKSTSKKLNIYKVNDLMSQRGWHLNALQFPSSVRMCFTAQHTEVVPELLKDLRDSVRALKDPNCVKDGKAPVYGMANIIPDRSTIW
ncbi:TPA: hypothetical protein ACH3X3_005299 [Trebouxia sp. C0006]